MFLYGCMWVIRATLHLDGKDQEIQSSVGVRPPGPGVPSWWGFVSLLSVCLPPPPPPRPPWCESVWSGGTALARDGLTHALQGQVRDMKVRSQGLCALLLGT